MTLRPIFAAQYFDKIMKKINTIFTILFSLAFLSVSAQKDSVQMEAGYANNIFYSLANGQIKKTPNNNWDLGFRTGFRTDGIFINSSNAAGPTARTSRLFLYPKGNISAWSTFDTTGRGQWLEYQNSDSSWEFGAFNRAAGAFPDFSWGVYNSTTKLVEGDSLYLLQITNGATTTFKKLQIIDKNFGVWHIRYADIDGSNEVIDTIVSSNANAKLLDYYSVLDGTRPNNEPDSLKDWDIVFKRYHELLPPTFDTYYPVMGIWSNKDVVVAEVRNTDIANFDYTTLAANDYKVAANIIGSDWKNFDMNVFQWKVEDSLAYYVKARTGAIWRLEFVSFGGTGNGRTVFNRTQMSPGLSVNPVAPVASFGIYPNPTAGNLEVVFENRENSLKNTIKIMDMAGKVVLQRNVESAVGFHANSFDVSSLASGVYIVNLENNGYVISQKLIKE